MYRTHFVFCLLSLLASTACGTAVPNYDDPNSIGVGDSTAGIDPRADTDGDGVFDVDEGSADGNMNGSPAHLDPDDVRLDGVTDETRDTDGDGTPDVIEGVADNNGNGVPAYRDPTEGGTGGGGPNDGGATAGDSGTGNQVAFGSPCTATDTCASAGGASGCCNMSTMTCGALSGGTCQSGVVCGTSFCAGAGACCASAGGCGVMASGSATCEATGGGSDGGAGEGGGGNVVDSCPMAGSDPGCCAPSGKCGVMNALLGCLEPDNILVDTPPPDLDCNP